MESLILDFRFGLRQMIKRPTFTITLLLIMALGIGANTAIFSVVNAVLLRPLPYPEADRIAILWESTNRGKESVSPLNFLDWKEGSNSFETMACLQFAQFTLTDIDEPERLVGANVSTDFFPVLGVNTALGRTFRAEEGVPGADKVAVLSDSLWKRRFHGNSDIINKTIKVDGEGRTVIGILPPDFMPPIGNAELWMPMAIDRNQVKRGSHFLRVLGRLKPGVTPMQAEPELNSIARRIAQEFPMTNKGRGVAVDSLREYLVKPARPSLLILALAVGFVLLLAGANMANLLLTRALERDKEIAIRTALGATRWRIIRQLFTETFALSLVGALAGLLLGWWGKVLLVNSLPDRSSIVGLDNVRIDGRVLAFTITISVVTGFLAGLVPSIRTSRADLQSALKDGTTGSGSGQLRQRFRGVLVVSEVALALVLLVGAGLLIKSLFLITAVDSGFNPTNVVAMQFSLPQSQYNNPAQETIFCKEVVERVKSIPGVQSVSLVSHLPLTSGGIDLSVLSIEGRAPFGIGEAEMVYYRVVSPGYFETMGIPLIRGQGFAKQDMQDSVPVMVINKTAARRLFPDQDAVGQRVKLDDGTQATREVVGVVGDVKYFGLDAEPRSEIYLSVYQAPKAFWNWVDNSLNLAVRSTGDPLAMSKSVRSEILTMDKSVPVYNVKSMEQLLYQSVASRRIFAALFGTFAAVALVLAAVGIHGLISYTVSQRTHEIGIRMALGAQRGEVFKSVIGQGMVLTVVGVGIGLLLSIGLTRYISSLLFQVSAVDPLTFAGVAGLLIGISFLASYSPARRATLVDPIRALRYE